METKDSYKDRKVIKIGDVCELTGLSVRQIRYYEERKLIFPDRSSTGIRKFSFNDVEKLVEIANHLADGVNTHEIRQELRRKQNPQQEKRNEMIEGQINAHFKLVK